MQSLCVREQVCGGGSGDIFFGPGCCKEFLNYQGKHMVNYFFVERIKKSNNHRDFIYCRGVKDVSQNPGGVLGETRTDDAFDDAADEAVDVDGLVAE